jgi:hypothetical protein
MCTLCGEEHPALYYCSEYINAKVTERFNMVKFQKTCGRCLTMARKFTTKKADWWPGHERFCKTVFACKEGQCGNKPKDRQLHMTVCSAHTIENRKREADFIKSLDVSRLPKGLTASNLQFLHFGVPAAYGAATGGSLARQSAAPVAGRVVDSEGYEIIPDVAEPGLFLMQMLPAEDDPSQELLCFYDSGCAAAGLSDRAYSLMRTTTVRRGPTVLDVAGAKSILFLMERSSFTWN